VIRHSGIERVLRGLKMAILIGDSIFSPSGKPGIVTHRNSISGELQVETGGKTFEAMRHRGFVNGLNSDDRKVYNKVIDEVRSEHNPEKRVSMITQEIDKLKVHPKNRVVVNYLEGEKAHIMYSAGIHPREYQIDEKNTRS
jgi:hypothetical protein